MDSPIAKAMLVVAAVAFAALVVFFGRNLLSDNIEDTSDEDTYYHSLTTGGACVAVGGTVWKAATKVLVEAQEADAVVFTVAAGDYNTAAKSGAGTATGTFAYCMAP